MKEIYENNPLLIVFFIMSLIGIQDIISEIHKDYANILSKNYIKKLFVFCAVYVKTANLGVASLVSVILFLTFPKVFFGKQTSVRFTQP
jgi:hypothetical protein